MTETTRHLPECPWPEKPCGPDHEPMHDRQPLFCVACLTECDCERINRVEQRLWQQPLLVVSRRAGWNDAIIAAREAVGRMVIETAGNSAATVDQALAAIDALREKP